MGTFWLNCPNLYWVGLLGTFQTFFGTKKVFSHLGTAKFKPEDVREALECNACAHLPYKDHDHIYHYWVKKKLLSNNFNFMEFGLLNLDKFYGKNYEQNINWT